MTTSLDATLAAIDTLAVHTCGTCDQPLPEGGVSDYFCGDWCQTAWYESNSERLTGYREPTDLAAHVYNLHEDTSPDCTPTPPWPGFDLQMPEWRGFHAALSPAVRAVGLGLSGLAEQCAVVCAVWDEWLRGAMGFEVLNVRPRVHKPAKPWDGLPAWLCQGCPEFEDCPARPAAWVWSEPRPAVMPPVPPVVLPDGWTRFTELNARSHR